MKESGFGIASLTLGILAITLTCFGGPIFAIPSLVLGIIGMTQKDYSRGTSIAGFICSLVSIFLFGLYLIIIVITKIRLNAFAKALDEMIQNLFP